MPQKLANRVVVPNLEVDGALLDIGGAAVPGAGIAVHRGFGAPRRDLFIVNNRVVSIAAAQDFGSVKLCDLPVGRTLLNAALVDLSIAVSAEIAPITIVDFALGTAAASSTALGTTQSDVVGKIDAPGTGLIQVAGPALLPLMLGQGAKALHLNFAAVIAADGTITVTGAIVLSYLDMGVAGA